ncbi:hypothetical protein ENSA5_33460 [Enhygromyxa salina]|uniref:Uncharacterized protein n=2 Tax=Enhygromyxa salina TaxID=215803 RepID=A0A2S9XXQ4_9BACT|nr:hypothetical protein ENSA5_33460 [Enhygromyxa salina]
MAARADVPEELQRFDALARSGSGSGSGSGPWPSFEEYSARIGGQLCPWRETCYFDVATDPALVSVANERFEALASALGFPIPAPFLDALRRGAAAGPEVLQIVLGIDAAPERARLKYYLIFRDRSDVAVERLRAALDVPPLPSSLQPGSVYILGIDFTRAQLSDFKVYVRLDPTRAPRVIRDLRRFEALWRGSRYLVFQHCQLSGGRQVYFHASSATVLETWLAAAAARDELAAEFVGGQIAAMNACLAKQGHQLLRPWIASLPYRDGALQGGPSNLYFHFSDAGS